jgi:hypothetical protein
VNFASLNLSPTDASQFTVTSYGTLKTRITPLHTCNKRSEALKSQTLLLQVLKNDVVSSFKHAFIKDIAQIVSTTAQV